MHVATTDSVWAFELGHRAAEIAPRLGVQKLRFAPGPMPSGEGTATPAEPVKPSPEDERKAAEIASQVEDEKLRESVQKAVSLSLARSASDRPI